MPVDNCPSGVLPAGGADPGVSAVGVGDDLPATFVLEAVVVTAQAPQIGRGGAPTGGERDPVVDVGELRWTVAPWKLAGAIPQPDISVQCC